MESHLSHDEFFTGLKELLDRRKGKTHGAVYLVQKRLTYGNEDAFPPKTSDLQFPDMHPTRPMPMLIRATDGKSKRSDTTKTKLSTVVQPDAIDGFFVRYADICKTSMTSLKPRDKSKRKAKAKKKKGAAPAAAS